MEEAEDMDFGGEREARKLDNCRSKEDFCFWYGLLLDEDLKSTKRLVIADMSRPDGKTGVIGTPVDVPQAWQKFAS